VSKKKVKFFGNNKITYNLELVEDFVFHGFARYASICQLDATHFVAVGARNIHTISMDAQYQLTVIDTFEIIGTQHNFYHQLVKIDDTHVALAYGGHSDDGHLRVFEIDGSYNISSIQILEHDLSQGTHNSLVMLDANHALLGFKGAASDGFVKIFEFAASTYAISQVGSLEHDGGTVWFNSVYPIDSSHFGLVVSNSTYQGQSRFRVFNYDGSYAITGMVQNVQITATGSAWHELIPLSSYKFLLATSTDAGGEVQVWTINQTTYLPEKQTSLKFCNDYAWNMSGVLIDNVGSKYHAVIFYSEGTSQTGTWTSFEVNDINNSIKIKASDSFTEGQNIEPYPNLFGRTDSVMIDEVDKNHVAVVWCTDNIPSGDDGIIRIFEIKK
jgi:hypothetical protein